MFVYILKKWTVFRGTFELGKPRLPQCSTLMKETRFLEKKEVNVPIVNLRYWLRPGDQGPEPA